MLLNAPQIGTVVRFAVGDYLFRQGQVLRSFHLIRSGVFHSRILRPDGTEILVELFGPGAVVGEGPAFSGAKRGTFVQAVSDAVVSIYTAEEMAECFGRQPEIAVSLIKLLGLKNRMLLNRISSITAPQPIFRVASLLYQLANHSSRQISADDSPGVSLSHEAIASMTALSRVSVTRSMAKLLDCGAIVDARKSHVTVDLAALREVLKSS
ncbi:MAG: Crp/Fnr family transcriptional regulator [Comamonas sp.]|jgi:CRP-like cAMP-binding protein|nr:Crp/Fnr family transcriptional regulator [Comamonas sp.]